MTPAEELVTTTRVATLLWHLLQGQELTNVEAGAVCGITPNGAMQMLYRISEVWPIYNFRKEGRDVWTLLRPD